MSANNPQDVKTAIVGAGFVSRCHVAALQSLGVPIVGIVGLVREHAEALAASCGAIAFDRLDDVIGKVNTVHICTPPTARLELALSAIGAGKHVFIEKPMAVDIRHAEAMFRAARDAGVKLAVGFNHRFRPGFQKLKSVVRSGALGEVTSAFVHRYGVAGNAGTGNEWRQAAGSAIGMTIESLAHDFGMLLELAGDVVEVKANVRGTLPDVPEFDNNADIIMKLKSGGGALIHASWSSSLTYGSRGVIGTKGAAILSGPNLWDFDVLRVKTRELGKEEIMAIGDIYHVENDQSYVLENRHFFESITTGSTLEIDGAMGLKTLKISHAVLDASRTNRTVSV
jgi:predicted dehydrogenase